jgi:hypothetical protein
MKNFKKMKRYEESKEHSSEQAKKLLKRIQEAKIKTIGVKKDDKKFSKCTKICCIKNPRTYPIL